MAINLECTSRSGKSWTRLF